jgi:polysaccharide deacetylase family protein (PEP-CTERM system associated)
MPDQSDKRPTSAKCLFSIDVEDWFHILDVRSSPPAADWDDLPSRVEKNFLHLLEILDRKPIKVTCFFLGWVAERFPHLVREASARGHEIASHGYAHRLVYKMTQREFYDDALKSRRLIEDISGKPVTGYRSSGFSVTSATPWFFDTLAEAGYIYDSSVFPAPRGHGGMNTNRFKPHRVKGNTNGIIEIPISVAKVMGRPICFFGGGYLRLSPYRIIRKMAGRLLDEGGPVNFYVHPREIDPRHPRLPMSPLRRFKSYVNLSSTEKKIRRLADDFDWMTFSDYIEENFVSKEKD